VSNAINSNDRILFSGKVLDHNGEGLDVDPELGP
jgi:hypothetical protein